MFYIKGMKNNHPIVVLVRGLPGSGKTYLANRLQESLGKENVVLLDPDAINTDSEEYKEHVRSQIAEGVDKSLHLYRFSRAKAYKGIEGDKIIIWNQPFTNIDIFNKMVGRLKDHALEFNKKLSILVVEVEIDPDVAKNRIIERKKNGGHGPSGDIWNQFVNDYKSFSEEGYNTITVRGDGNVSESVMNIEEALKSL